MDSLIFKLSVQCLRIIFSETVHECLGFLSGKGIRAGQKAAFLEFRIQNSEFRFNSEF